MDDKIGCESKPINHFRGKIIDQESGEKDYTFTAGMNKITIKLQENNFSFDSNVTV